MKTEDNKDMDWHIKSFEDLSKTELYKLIQLRIEVFIIEQNCPYQECDGLDLEAMHLLGYYNDEIVAYLRILPKGVQSDQIVLGRILTKESMRGKKMGKQLVQKGLEFIEKEYKTQEVMISAQTYLIKFYENFGFKIDGEEYLEDDIPHIEMIRN